MCFCVICASRYLWLWVCLCVSVSVSLYACVCVPAEVTSKAVMLLLCWFLKVRLDERFLTIAAYNKLLLNNSLKLFYSHRKAIFTFQHWKWTTTTLFLTLSIDFQCDIRCCFFTDGKGILLSVSLLLILGKKHRVTKVIFSGSAVNPSVIIKHRHLAGYMYRTYQVCKEKTTSRKNDTWENCSKIVKNKDFNQEPFSNKHIIVCVVNKYRC